MNIIKFPIINNHSIKMPKQRVFYICYKLTGPFLCQEGYHFYLKRKGLKNGKRKWSIITYEKYDEFDTREHSIELDECDENDIYKMLSEWNLANDVSLDELKRMGWNGRISCNAQIIPFKSK